MLGTAKRAQPSDAGIDDLEVRSVALAEERAFDVGRLELPALEEDFPGVADERLAEVEGPTVYLGKAYHDVDIGFCRNRGQRCEFGTVCLERVRVIARNELHASRRCPQPQPPRIAGDPDLRECEQLCAGGACL